MSTGFQTREITARVRHPLDAVRKYIRRYVLLEGAAIVLFGVAVWFWVGMLVDFGLFWATAYDWVLELDFLDPSGQGSLWIRVGVFLIVRANRRPARFTDTAEKKYEEAAGAFSAADATGSESQELPSIRATTDAYAAAVTRKDVAAVMSLPGSRTASDWSRRRQRS